jgi:CRP-like cAMP-binding protein
VAEEKKIAKNVYLFREGDAPDAMYIVKSGEFVVTKTKGNSEVVLADIQPGSMVGEMALFDSKPRSANVKALKDSEVMILPYESLNKQLELLPVWVKSIIKKLNENIREANKKIKILETVQNEEDRFPPHIVNKYISILNLVCNKYGKPEANGAVGVSSVLLRNYTIQIFQEATNKMQSVVTALTDLGYLIQEDRGDGSQKIINAKPSELFEFVDWYNEWLFELEKKRLQSLTDTEVKILNGLLHFAKKTEPNSKGLHKVDLTDVQNDSMRELGFLLKIDDVNPLATKEYISERILDDKGTYLMVEISKVEPMAKNWTLVNNLKKKLR